MRANPYSRETADWRRVVMGNSLITRSRVVAAESEGPVEAFSAGGPHEAFGVRVCPAGMRQGLEDLDAVGGENGVEGLDELGVSVVGSRT